MTKYNLELERETKIFLCPKGDELFEIFDKLHRVNKPCVREYHDFDNHRNICTLCHEEENKEPVTWIEPK